MGLIQIGVRDMTGEATSFKHALLFLINIYSSAACLAAEMGVRSRRKPQKDDYTETLRLVLKDRIENKALNSAIICGNDADDTYSIPSSPSQISNPDTSGFWGEKDHAEVLTEMNYYTAHTSEAITDLLLQLSGPLTIDSITESNHYTVLHEAITRIIAGHSSLSSLIALLQKSPNIHQSGNNCENKMAVESPMSLAMYNPATLAIWRDALLAVNIDLEDFVDAELKRNATSHLGWSRSSMLSLLNEELQHHPATNPNGTHCVLCGAHVRIRYIGEMAIEAEWRHVLEKYKRRPSLDNPHNQTEGVEEKYENAARSATMNGKKSRSETATSSSAPEKPHNRHPAESPTGPDSHGYPNTISPESYCMYKPQEILCMRCWLHYIDNGAWFPWIDRSFGSVYSKRADEDEAARKEEKKKQEEDEFSPFHIHA